MSGLAILTIEMGVFLGLLFWIRRRIATIQKSFFQIAEEDIVRAYREIDRQKRQQDLDPKLAVARFNARANRTVNHYVHQVHGGEENTPLKEYQALNRRIAQLQKKLYRDGTVLFAIGAGRRPGLRIDKSEFQRRIHPN